MDSHPLAVVCDMPQDLAIVLRLSNCPIIPESSTTPCRYENSAGTRCISSKIVFSG